MKSTVFTGNGQLETNKDSAYESLIGAVSKEYTSALDLSRFEPNPPVFTHHAKDPRDFIKYLRDAMIVQDDSKE